MNTATLANTAIESYGQTPASESSDFSSCLDCHAFGSPQLGKVPRTQNLQIFSFVLQNAFLSPKQKAIPRRRFLDLLQKAPHSSAQGEKGDTKYKQK